MDPTLCCCCYCLTVMFMLCCGIMSCCCCCADHLEPYGEAVAILDFARAEAGKRARHLRHPQLCLDAIQTGVEQGGRAGLVKVGRMWGFWTGVWGFGQGCRTLGRSARFGFGCKGAAVAVR